MIVLLNTSTGLNP